MNQIFILRKIIKPSFIMIVLICCASKVHAQRDPNAKVAASIIYEAENGTFGGNAKIQTSTNASMGSLVGSIYALGDFTQISNVNGGTGGSHSLVIRYSNGWGPDGILGLYVNGIFIQNVSFPTTGDWNIFTDATLNITLVAGTSNTIKLQHGSGLSPADIDKFTVSTGTLGINTLPNNVDFEVSISPNPVRAGNLIISTPGVAENKILNIYDVSGKKIFTQQLSASTLNKIDLSNLNYKGFCLVEVSNETGIVVKKIIME